MPIQLPFDAMLPESEWQMPEEFPDLGQARSITVDVETCDPHLRDKGPGFIRGDAFIAGYAVHADFSNGERFCRYFPVRHCQGPNLPPNIVASWLADQLKGDQDKRMAGGIYDLEAMWHDGIRKIGGRILDLQVAGPLIDEESKDGYDLDTLSKRYGREGKVEEILKAAAQSYSHGGRRRGKGNLPFDPKKDLWLMPAKYVGPYAEGDAVETHEVSVCQMAEISKEGLGQIFDLETLLIPLLLQMRLRGVRVDLEYAEGLAKEITRDVDRMSMEIKEIVGFDLNIDSNPQLTKAYEEWNRKNFDQRVEFQRTAASVAYPVGQLSFNKEWLALQSDPLSTRIAQKRKLMTMRDDFIVGDILGSQVNGRIHAQFHQLRQRDKGTRTGRFSSTNPNLQQVPKRDKVWGKKIRACFLADKGQVLFKGDYSQQEPRLLLHFAYLAGMPGAKEAVETFRKNPRTDYHGYTCEICNNYSDRQFIRDEVKAINLGIMYTMGLEKLCQQLRVGQSVGKMILDAYHRALPFVKGMISKVSEVAENRGFIRTILCRILHFPLWEPVPIGKERPALRGLQLEEAQAAWPGRRLRRWGTHKAVNKLIQGSAADQTKKAMAILFHQFGKVPLIQVHDELVASVDDNQEARLFKKVMEEAVVLQLPVVCDGVTGANWGYAKDEVMAG